MNTCLQKSTVSNQVIVTNLRNIICKGNVFKISFHCKFKSECAKAGDNINFDVHDAIYTQEGILLIPAGSKVEYCENCKDIMSLT